MGKKLIGILDRVLHGAPSRRDVLRALAGASLGLGMLWRPAIVGARKKRKRKHRKKAKKAQPNQFGCLEVGDPCRSEADCCSGICEGKTCRAHDTGTCGQEGRGACSADSPVGCNNGAKCLCLHTTAGSNACAQFFDGPLTDQCAACAKDTDCEALGYPPGSVCVPTAEGPCSDVCDTGTACLAPCGVEFSDPIS